MRPSATTLPVSNPPQVHHGERQHAPVRDGAPPPPPNAPVGRPLEQAPDPGVAGIPLPALPQAPANARKGTPGTVAPQEPPSASLDEESLAHLQLSPELQQVLQTPAALQMAGTLTQRELQQAQIGTPEQLEQFLAGRKKDWDDIREQVQSAGLGMPDRIVKEGEPGAVHRYADLLKSFPDPVEDPAGFNHEVVRFVHEQLGSAARVTVHSRHGEPIETLGVDDFRSRYLQPGLADAWLLKNTVQAGRDGDAGEPFASYLAQAFVNVSDRALFADAPFQERQKLEEMDRALKMFPPELHDGIRAMLGLYTSFAMWNEPAFSKHAGVSAALQTALGAFRQLIRSPDAASGEKLSRSVRALLYTSVARNHPALALLSKVLGRVEQGRLADPESDAQLQKEAEQVAQETGMEELPGLVSSLLGGSEHKGMALARVAAAIGSGLATVDDPEIILPSVLLQCLFQWLKEPSRQQKYGPYLSLEDTGRDEDGWSGADAGEAPDQATAPLTMI